MIVDNYRIYWKYTTIQVNYLGYTTTIKSDSKLLPLHISYIPKKQVIRTECFIVNKDNNVELAHSWVQPHHTDRYDKEKGRKIVLKRALSKLNASRELRTKIWEAYRTMSPTPKW